MRRSKRNLLFSVALAAPLLVLFNNCSPSMKLTEQASLGDEVKESAFKCADAAQTSLSGSYLLTKNQYQNAIEDLFGAPVLAAVSTELSTLFTDIFDTSSYKRLTSISPTQVESYFNAAQAIAGVVVSNTALTAKVFGTCANTATPNSSCIDNYLNGYAKKILRRPLTDSEKNFAKQVMATTGDYKENLKGVLASHLTSPSFLWRIELGLPAQASSTPIRLTGYEVASRLAFMLTDSTPDDDLLRAAEAGTLDTNAGLQGEVGRLMQSKRGKAKTVDSILRWSQTDSVQSLAGLPSELKSGIAMAGLEIAMVDEAKKFAEYIIYDQGGSFNDLLTSKVSFASHAGLAKLYNHTPVADPHAPATFGDRRQGILMRAPAMTWSVARTNIILRGVNFQKQILCNEIPAPSVDIVADRDAHSLTEDEILMVDNRTSVAYKTESPVCMACHSMINPVGFALESFDSLGGLRTKEKVFDSRIGNALVRELPLNTSSQIPFSRSEVVAVQDAYDLVDQIARSSQGTACFTRKTFRYLYERKESALDSCQLSSMQEKVTDPNQPILTALQALVLNSHIYYKDIQ